MFLHLKSIGTGLLLGLAINVFSLFNQPAHAGLYLSPMYLKMESEQGQSKGVLQVGNTSAKPIRVRLSTAAFTYNKSGLFRRRSNLEGDNRHLEKDLTPYLRYSPQEMVIPANSSRRIRLISLLPPSLPEGEYRTAIFAETLQQKTNSQGYKVGLNISIGSALYVAKGELEPDISITKTNFDAKNNKIKLLVTNEGDATAKGKIEWTLKQNNQKIASGESGSSFLPDSQTNIVLNRQEDQNLDLVPGSYQLVGDVIWDNADDKEVESFNLELKL